MEKNNTGNFENIKKILDEEKVYQWELTETLDNGWEFYFIRHKLDQNRVRNVVDIELKVYEKSEDGKYLGSASAVIQPGSTDSEIRKIVKDLKFRASLIKNPFYTIATKEEVEAVEGACNKSDAAGIAAPSEIAKDFIELMQDLPETQTEDVNSYEIFANNLTVHFLNSNGVEFVEKHPRSMLELVVNARNESHEIELYRMYESGTCDTNAMKERISETLTEGKDRLKAEPTPKLVKYDCVFSTDDSKQIYDYFVDNMRAVTKYRGITDWEVDEPLDKDMKGDKVTVKAVRNLPNSSGNIGHDEEGSPIRDLVLIEDGVAKNFMGARQYCEYLGLKGRFIPSNIEVSGGSHTEEEVRSGDYLEVVEFSDFQVDFMTGDLLGEIRLGYWHHAGEVTIVSGGSVSGNMGEALKTMIFSKEQTQYNSMVVPKVTRLSDLTVTGLAELEG